MNVGPIIHEFNESQQKYINSLDFSQKCKEVRQLLIKLSRK